MVKSRLAQRHPVRPRQVLLAHRLHDGTRATAGYVDKQTGGPFHGRRLQLVINPARVPVRGIGIDAEAPGRRRGGLRRKVGAFEKHIAGCCSNSTSFTAHDACQGDGTIVVGNQQYRFVYLDVVPVEQCHRLAAATVAHHDAAGQLIEIEGVHRLTEFEQNVVCHVHRSVDRA